MAAENKIMVLGHYMDLPFQKDLSADQFFKLIEDKKVAYYDLIAQGFSDPWEMGLEDGNPWSFASRVGQKFLKTAWGDTDLLQISEKESKFMHIVQIIGLLAAWKGLESSGIPPSLLHKTRTGVFVAGTTLFGNFTSFPGETSLRGSLTSSLADRIAYFLGTHGPNIAMETACSSSLVAMTLAANAIKDGSCEVALVVGINICTREYELGLQAAGVMSRKQKSLPFDVEADGIVRCEGYGCIVLASHAWAVRHKYMDSVQCQLVNATIGSAGAAPTAQQGSGRVYEQPNAHGIIEMVRLCHQQASLPLRDIKYVEAHATGAPVGDLIELEALQAIYRDSHDMKKNPLRLGSVKGNIGHAEVAAGLFSVIKAIEMIRLRTFLPTGGVDIRPRSDFDWDGSNIRLCLESEPFPPERGVCIGVNSFGIGGTYAHAILSEVDSHPSLESSRQLSPIVSNGRVFLSENEEPIPLIFSISAASVEHLDAYERNVASFLEVPCNIGVLDMCGCFAINRARLSVCRNYVVNSVEELGSQLRLNTAEKPTPCELLPCATVAFVFTGQGAQWVTMGMNLMVFSAYRETVMQFDKIYSELSGWSPAELVHSLHEDEISNTMYAQPLTCMVQMGLVELLRYFGVKPMAVIGHSAGEIPALWCCGALSMEQAAMVIYHRSCCQQQMSGCGRMLAVQMSKNDAENLLRTIQSSCCIACVNSPTSVVMAGAGEELENVRKHLPEGYKSTFLKGNTAFHSPLMDPCLPEVYKKLKKMPLDWNPAKVESIPIVSTVTGELLEHLSVQYFLDNIRESVQFMEGIQCLRRLKSDVILEIGPHKTLVPAIIQSLGDDCHVNVLETLGHQKDDPRAFLQVLMRLMNFDVKVDMSDWYRDLGYSFGGVMHKGIPTHPLLKPTKPECVNLMQKVAKFTWNAGPAVGNLSSQDNKNLFISEICKETCPVMMDHVISGQAILPGMYFVEAALEAWFHEGDPMSGAVMTDVTFESICRIPNRSKGDQTTKLVVRKSSWAKNGLIDFTVESKKMFGQETTIHCTGALASFCCSNMLNGGLIPGRNGLLESRPGLHDLGKDRLQEIWNNHTSVLDHDQVYKMINKEGKVEYGNQFRVIQEARTSEDGRSIIASLCYEHEKWSNVGGQYAIPLLDGILQLGFLNFKRFDMGNVVYAGGFESGIFIRRPKENTCIALFEVLDPVPDTIFTVNSNAWLYDTKGNLLVHLAGIRSILGRKATKVQEVFQIWQPMLPLEAHFELKRDFKSLSTDRYTQNIASMASQMLEKKIEASNYNIATLRLLEYIEDESQESKIIESLVREKKEDLLEAPLLIEIFIATHNPAIARKSFVVPYESRKWLTVRVICLPGAKDMVLSLYRFDMILVSETVLAPNWQSHKEALLDIAHLGHMKCLLIHDFQLDSSCIDYVSQEAHLGDNMYASQLRHEFLCKDQPRGKDILILSCNREWGSRLSTLLMSRISAYKSKWNIQLLALQGDNIEEEGTIQELSNFAKTNPDNEKHIVFVDGMFDTTKYAQQSFLCIARVAKVLGASLLLQGNKSCLWICTSGVYSSTIDINRCALSSLSRSITSEFRSLYAKHVDAEDPSRNLEALSTVIICNLGGSRIVIDKDNSIYDYLYVPSDVKNVYGSNDGYCINSNDPQIEYRCQIFQCPEKGMLEYDFFIHPSKNPGTGEVLVQVHASSLNFRDVMLTLNALPKASFEGSFYGRNLGMEASGVILKVGEGVTHLKVGDPVLLCEPACFASKLIAPAERVMRIPGSNIDLLNAASLSSVYCTAYYALIQLANIQKGESVLVHAAAGGVGHAAVSICQYVGATLYITASESKQSYYATTFGIPKSQIFNSRDTSWYRDIMDATNCKGVDVVLNCLALEHQKLGIEALKPGGRFCEIGKMDIYNNNALYLYQFRKNIAFFAIDMDRMNQDSPGKVQEISTKVFEHIAQGHFKLIPYRTFTMNKIRDAIECMKSGKHIGKILLTNYENGPVKITCRKALRFNPDSIFFILGGLGGFGSRIIEWAFSHGARKFVTTARNPSRMANMFPHLRSRGATIDVLQVDLAQPTDLNKIEHHLLHGLRSPVETIVHCAGIYESFHFQNISRNDLEHQARIKVDSAVFLHKLSLKLEHLSNFIIVGSTSVDSPAHFMATYSSSNAMLEGVARQREHLNLPVTIINMTSIEDVGLVQSDSSTREFQDRMGIEPVSSARALLSLETLLEKGRPSMMQYQFMSPEFKMSKNSFWFETHGTMSIPGQMVFGNTDIIRKGHWKRSLEDTMGQIISFIQSSQGVSDFGPNTLISSTGIDSFGMMDLAQQVQAEFDYVVDPSVFGMTVRELATTIYKSR